MKRKKSKITVGVMGVLLGSTVIFGQPKYTMYMDIMEDVATTQSSEVTGKVATTDESDTETVDIGDVSMEDTKIVNTTYINYGEGGVLVNVIKDSAVSEEIGEDSDTNELDNAEKIAESVSPEVTEEVVTEEIATQPSLMSNTYICSSVELVDACLSDEEKVEVEAGGTKELRVTIHVPTEEEIKQKKLEEIGTAMDDYMLATTGLSFCNYLQIIVEKKDAETGKWKKMKNFEKPVEVSVDIFSEYQNDKGYFQMLVPNGNVYDLLDDEDEYGQTITFAMRGTGIYALCYQAEIAKEEVITTQAPKSSFLGKLMKDDFCLWHGFMGAFFIIGFTWVAAINTKKKRVIFMTVMDALFLICAIMGRCLYCWIFLVVFIIILFLLHVWKTKRMEREEQIECK